MRRQLGTITNKKGPYVQFRNPKVVSEFPLEQCSFEAELYLSEAIAGIIKEKFQIIKRRP